MTINRQASEQDGTLLKNRDFMLFWTGQSISDLGAAVTTLAVPLVAVTMLRATTFEVGVLTACATAAWLIMTLPAGMIVDRVAKRPLMIGCGVARGAVVASIPVAAALGHLTISHLYAMAFLVGSINVVFEIACQSYLPVLLSRRRLIEGNGKIATTNAVALAVGPSLAGGLMTLLHTAARVMVVDCLSYVIGIASLLLIRTPESRPPVRESRSMRKAAAEGITFVLGHPVLRRVVACSAISNLCDAMITTLVVVFVLGDLGADPATLGLVLGLGSAGGIVGGVLATSFARWVGPARALWAGKLCLGGFTLLIPLGGPGWGVLAVAAGLFASRLSTVAYNVLQITYRQSICPPELLGRMNASIRWLIRGAMPFGGLLAGTLGAWLGARTTLAVAVTCSWLAVLWLVFSPLRRQRDIALTPDWS
ncbi:MFS transporter [Nonomuraea sp. NPDC048901]|uniref:MFS transporter n=1 Tax=Nonomuraea sp. NPDC048901 TaxID=3155627 RepID=UPI0033F9870E